MQLNLQPKLQQQFVLPKGYLLHRPQIGQPRPHPHPHHHITRHELIRTEMRPSLRPHHRTHPQPLPPHHALIIDIHQHPTILPKYIDIRLFPHKLTNYTCVLALFCVEVLDGVEAIIGEGLDDLEVFIPDYGEVVGGHAGDALLAEELAGGVGGGDLLEEMGVVEVVLPEVVGFVGEVRDVLCDLSIARQ